MSVYFAGDIQWFFLRPMFGQTKCIWYIWIIYCIKTLNRFKIRSFGYMSFGWKNRVEKCFTGRQKDMFELTSGLYKLNVLQIWVCKFVCTWLDRVDTKLIQDKKEYILY